MNVSEKEPLRSFLTVEGIVGEMGLTTRGWVDEKCDSNYINPLETVSRLIGVALLLPPLQSGAIRDYTVVSRRTMQVFQETPTDLCVNPNGTAVRWGQF